MKKFKQIIALGGGGFSMEQDNPLLDNYILSASGKPNPKICFFANAGGDAQDYIDKFYNVYNKLECIPTHLSLKTPPEINLEKFILEQDILFVGGGSTRFLLAQWKTYGIDKIMKKAYDKGIVLSGMSAGAIIWFSDGIFNPTDKKLMKLPCLGFLQGSFCPHYDERTELRFSFRELITEGGLKNGYGVEDYCGLHFIGKDLYNVISSRKGVKAYSVRKTSKTYIESELPSTYLGINYKAVPKNENLNLIKEFVYNINEHDIDEMLKYLSDDHLMTDSSGIKIRGLKHLKIAWLDFFIHFPDYTIEVSEIICTETSAAIFGKAKGTYWQKGELEERNKFEVPASWQAKITDGKISEWKVFADVQIVRQIMEANN
ncbi:MAG: Type 1 glutamine amidotransferase-like domain-containing protein [Bacteroidetes bacterium]|nr:Type 1 glutamine amidotransferase-like domain-containing protein [Bacteroidota bacterium]